MAVIVPTVTAEDTHTYRAQLEKVTPFAKRIHLDFMDGLFTKNASINLKEAWVPEDTQIDLHLMYMRPDLYMDDILRLNPSLVIVHAESKCDLRQFAAVLHNKDIQVGIALLQETSIDVISDTLSLIDHALIFSGNLGHFGGDVNLELLDKVADIKQRNAEIEIGWDGGISEDNAAELISGGVEVLNTGGFIQRTEDPAAAYWRLSEIAKLR